MATELEYSTLSLRHLMVFSSNQGWLEASRQSLGVQWLAEETRQACSHRERVLPGDLWLGCCLGFEKHKSWVLTFFTLVCMLQSHLEV